MQLLIVLPSFFFHQKRQLSAKEQLILRLESQYPADVGILAAFFLNYVELKPGEALYVGPNEPHAYISGECIECMATSDNVVRAGLTSKKRDVQALLSMLNYKQVITYCLQELVFIDAILICKLIIICYYWFLLSMSFILRSKALFKLN